VALITPPPTSSTSTLRSAITVQTLAANQPSYILQMKPAPACRRPDSMICVIPVSVI
jgi:hypothetical protein